MGRAVRWRGARALTRRAAGGWACACAARCGGDDLAYGAQVAVVGVSRGLWVNAAERERRERESELGRALARAGFYWAGQKGRRKGRCGCGRWAVRVKRAERGRWAVQEGKEEEVGWAAERGWAGFWFWVSFLFQTPLQLF